MLDKGSQTKQKEYKITSEGSLGLLALGAVGLKAWRKVRKEELGNNKKDNSVDKG